MSLEGRRVGVTVLEERWVVVEKGRDELEKADIEVADWWWRERRERVPARGQGPVRGRNDGGGMVAVWCCAPWCEVGTEGVEDGQGEGGLAII